MTNFTNLVDLLQHRAAESANKKGYIFLKDGENELGSLTYQQLDQQARAIAATLQAQCDAGQRALLLLSPSLDYIAAFWGCLYAGIIAVPAYPPQSRKNDESRLKSIVQNADIKIILTSSALMETMPTFFLGDNSDYVLLSIDTLTLNSAQSWQRPSVLSGDQLAFLQYTSGSTSQAKGVMISHANLLHNLAITSRLLGFTLDDIMVSWLPPYHDMGLIAGLLCPVYNGAQAIAMTPQAFLQSPFRWLKTMSDYRATFSGAPNFAFEFCLKNINAQQKSQLDLSSLRLLANGAEPIRASTMEKFANYFASCGFKRQALCPVYGLAESTLTVAGKTPDSLYVQRSISRKHLELNQIAEPENADDNKQIISSGVPAFEQELHIVNPIDLTLCKTNEIGEIWIKGNSVAAGYWNQSELTQDTFHAHLANDAQHGSFLRTGDWGFQDENQALFITGRIKELLIINGRNHYPQDIVRTVQGIDVALRTDGGAAFTIEINNEERLVIVQEIERTALRNLDSETLFSEIRQAISLNHGLKVYGIVFIKPLWLPRTSSGKIQHYRAKQEYLSESLKAVASWHESDVQQLETGTVSSRKADAIINWLRAYAPKRINSRLIDERRCILPHVVLDFGNQGLLGMSVPEELGGLGLDTQDMIRIVVQLSAIDSTLGAFVGIQNSIGILPILNHATPEKKATFLPTIASGRELVSFAITEELAGSDPKSIKASAIPDKKRGGWLINGKKIWIGNAVWASVFNVFVQLLDEQGNPQGITGFVVRQEAEGVLSGEEYMTMGVRGMVQSSVLFNNVHVTEADLLGQIGQGFTIAQEAMQYARLGIAASALGGMQCCLQFMYNYASRRQISTGLLLNNPVTLEKITHASIAIVSIESLVNVIAELLDQRVDIPDEIYLICKTSAPEFAFQVADNAMQLLGGRGYCESNLIPQFFRDIRLLRIFEGPTETLNMYLGSILTHTPERFYGFLEHTLNTTEIVEQLKIGIAKLELQVRETSPFSERINAIRWQQSCIGELATQLVIKAFLIYASKETRSETQKTLITQAIKHHERQYQQQLEQILLTQQGDIIENNQVITAFMTELRHNIGATEFIGYSEDHKLDDFLRRTELPSPSVNDAPPDHEKSAKALEIEHWIIQWLSRYLQIDAGQIYANTLLIEYGIDSINAVELARDLEIQFNLTLDSNVVWNFPKVGDLACYIESKLTD